MTSSETTHSRVHPTRRRWVALLVLCTISLVAQRLLYHHAYLHFDPFAHATFSDGQVYEEAARDILAERWVGSQPFFLQGAYAYFLALGLAPRGVLSDALLAQLALASAAWVCIFAAARRASLRGEPFDAWLSCALGLAYAGLAFYENKYLSAELGVVANAAQLAAFARVIFAPSLPGAVLLGVATAASILARPNLVLSVPFAAYVVWRSYPRHAKPLQLCAAALGLALTLAPLATRNLIVTGTPSVFPSHGGGIPFYIGNHPGATGLWNDAGGLISGQVLEERRELAARLGVAPQAPNPDAQIGRELYARALRFMRSEPLAWLHIELTKLWYTLGNDELTHDYDALGERELLGDRLPLKVPFGVLLGLGAFGLVVLGCGTAQQRLLALALSGQLGAVLAANLLWFTSAQNRLPCAVPLLIAIAAASSKLRELPLRSWSRGWAVAALGCSLLCAQACLPRRQATRPSSAHYYNLANVEEALGLYEAALTHYTRASVQNPKQPMFWLRLAHLARRVQRPAQASAALDQLAALPQLSPPFLEAIEHERSLLAALPH